MNLLYDPIIQSVIYVIYRTDITVTGPRASIETVEINEAPMKIRHRPRLCKGNRKVFFQPGGCQNPHAIGHALFDQKQCILFSVIHWIKHITIWCVIRSHVSDFQGHYGHLFALNGEYGATAPGVCLLQPRSHHLRPQSPNSAWNAGPWNPSIANFHCWNVLPKFAKK